MLRKLMFGSALACAAFLAFSVPATGSAATDSPCSYSTTGCSGCSVSFPCTATLVPKTNGQYQCCKDFDGDGVYHQTTCDWQTNTCVIFCPSFDPSQPPIQTQYDCNQLLGCTTNQPLATCTAPVQQPT